MVCIRIVTCVFGFLCVIPIKSWSQGYVGLCIGVSAVTAKHRKEAKPSSFKERIKEFEKKIATETHKIDDSIRIISNWNMSELDAVREEDKAPEITYIYKEGGREDDLGYVSVGPEDDRISIYPLLVSGILKEGEDGNGELDFDAVLAVGLGGAPDPDGSSLFRASLKLQKIFGVYSKWALSYLQDLGFYIPGYEIDKRDPSVIVSGEPGSARGILAERVSIAHKLFSSFDASLFENNGKCEYLKTEYFFNHFTFRNAIHSTFFSGLENRMMAAWDDVAVDLAQQEAALADAARLAGTETETHSTHFTFGLVAGLDKSRFCSKASQYGLYLGAEAFYDGNFGEIDIPTCGEGLVPQTKLTLKARNALGASGLVGVTTRGGWTLYAPISAKANYYRFGLEKPTSASPTELDGLVSLLEQNKNTSQPSFGSWNDHENHWKFEGEAGVGVRLNVSQRLTMGFRWTHSFGSKISFDTPAYKAQSVREIDSKGATHEIDSSQQRLVFECLLRL